MRSKRKSDTAQVYPLFHQEETLFSNIRALFSVTKMRWRNLAKYRFYIILDALNPIFITLMPILLGIGIAGSLELAVENFNSNVGTKNAFFYLFIGALIFNCVNNSLWMVGNWMRQEQMRGTLEVMYSLPTSRTVILAGMSLYVMTRNIFTITVALLISIPIFNINPIQGNTMLALLFFLIGFIPLFGISIIFGSIVLHVKEIGPLVNVLNWIVGLLSGLFVPVLLLPVWLRTIALSIPVSWQLQGIRSALFELNYFLNNWYLDLAVLFLFASVLPFIGMKLFSRTEKDIKRGSGVGKF